MTRSSRTASTLLLLALSSRAQLSPCATAFDCSLNGLCVAGACACDAPWVGASCETLQFAVSPASAKNLWTGNASLNTWSGPILRDPAGIFHFYVPVYEHASLWKVIYTAHGTADAIEGPYNWSSRANISATGLNPAGLVFPDPATGAPVYSLWDQQDILTSASADGPFVRAYKNPMPSSTAPCFSKGAFYLADQSMRRVLTTRALDEPWTVFSNITLPHLTYAVEDSFLWVDPRGNFHIINHAYSTAEKTSCGSSHVSSHSFSANGTVWGRSDQPYGHTVHFDDGSSHTYATLERPYLNFDASGRITHLHVAADLVTGDEGCAPTPCVNCKYVDHAGTVIIKLGASQM